MKKSAKWFAEGHQIIAHESGNQMRLVAYASGPESVAFAARIVDCLNALDGIEDLGAVHSILRIIRETSSADGLAELIRPKRSG